MGKVYAPPEELGPVPEFVAGESFDAYLKRQDDYVNSVVEWAKSNGSSPYAGREARFPVGDGYARYVVQSLKPLVLIWLPVGDAWQYQYVERLTATDIKERIDQQEAVRSMFSKK